MASTKQIRQRIKSIGNTRKITKAMEMVAAAKMKKAQDLALNSRDYSQEAWKILDELNRLEINDHILLKKNPLAQKSLLIIITSDRGLSGSYNASVIKASSQYIRDSKTPVDIVTVGKKSQDFFKITDQNVIATFTKLPTYPRTSDLQPIIKLAQDDFSNGVYQNVTVIYTYFHSTVRTEVVTQQILPIQKNQIETNQDTISIDHKTEFLFEPDKKAVLHRIVPRLIEVLFYQFFLNAIACEYSSQMIAMKNASDNAKDIISDLQILYNTLRQASITQELAEITSGAAALE